MPARDPEETTPLLAGNSRRPEPQEDGTLVGAERAVLPAIQPTLTRLQRDGIPQNDEWAPSELSFVQKTAYMLIALAKSRVVIGMVDASRSTDDIWEEWEHSRAALQLSVEA